METKSETHKKVQQHYGEFARSGVSNCCGPQNTFYPLEALKELPSDIANFTAGSGDPVTPADIKPGETILDLGSGGGLDCFLAARQVGATGRVIGVDMTPEMLSRARLAAARLNLANVEFREGFLEALPVEDGSIDAVVSNCVINLSPDKPKVLDEIFRVLKPGGRISISDIVTNRPVPEELKSSDGEWCSCVSGALPKGEYEQELTRAGFTDIQISPDLAAARQALVSGEYLLPKGTTKEEALRMIENPDDARSIFLPHLISARKPR